MYVLAIGNSFSQDATRYLHQIAKAGGEQIEVVNLYIPSCSLDRHYRNMLTGARDYGLQFNGQVTGFNVSLEEALLNREWDVVTLQQQSVRSANYDTFNPYIKSLYDYVKECVPKAKILLHQTWALETGSDRIAAAGFENYEAMMDKIEDSYIRCHAAIGTDGVIPSGRLLGKLLRDEIPTVHRDGLHVTKGLGRYALGLLWYHMLTGRAAFDNTFCDFDEPVSDEDIRIAKACVDSIAPIRKLK